MSARSRRFRRSKAEAAQRKAEAVKSIEPGQVWRTKRRHPNGKHTRLIILKVWDRAVTVTNLQSQNQRGLGIEDLLTRYQKEA